jgi:hypothetical protein
MISSRTLSTPVRGVELVDVRMLAGGDQPALLARAVGKRVRTRLAEEGLGEQTRHGGLARAPGTAEEVGVARLALGDGALEGLDHVLLAHDVGERLRTVLPVQRFHGASGRFDVLPSSIAGADGARHARGAATCR